jgi:tetratricopeptide (TPR) repeat protein
MRALTVRRAAVIAGAVAFVVFLPSVKNGWSGDDALVIEVNAFIHGAGSALGAWFETYWRYPYASAGLYRPLTILTYGVDWSVAGGAPWWFHLVNVAIHAVVAGLVVVVLAAWLRPVLGLVAGLVFAVHPVHVEAVANVVGRAELLVALGLLGAVVAARCYRAAEDPRVRAWWLALTLALVVFGLFAKENGIIALPLLVLDHLLTKRGDRRLHGGLYIGVAVVSLAWFHLWSGIAGQYTHTAAHGAFFGLTTGDRLATMFPAYLQLLRLLVMPVWLSSEYSPQVVSLRYEWGWLATLGLLATTSVAALGVVAVRRAPAVAFSILVFILSYAPVANLLFPSGVILSERGLYLGVLVPSAVTAIAFEIALRRGRMGIGIGGVTAVVVAFALLTTERIPFWKDALNPILEERAAHPENYRNRYLLSEYLSLWGDSTAALSEMLVAVELNPTEPFLPMYASRLAVSEGRPAFAVELAEEAYRMHPTDGRIQEMLIVALLEAGKPDSALRIATASMRATPTSQRSAANLVYVLEQTDAPEWKRLLAVGRRKWLDRDLVSAVIHLDSAAAVLPRTMRSSGDCRFLEPMLPMAEWIATDLAGQLRDVLERSPACSKRGPS